MSRERRNRPTFHPLAPAAVLLLVLGALLWTPARPAWSDDRELLRAASGKPYVFLLLDTSGSMNEVTETATEALAAGDDPASKLYQAKEALYKVVEKFDKVLYGFGTFNQDGARARRKHWIYRPTEATNWNGSATPLDFPTKDQGYAFGGGGNSTLASCTSPRTLPTTAANFRELIGHPRTGDDGRQTFGMWLRHNPGRIFYVETTITSGDLGDATITVQHRRRRVAPGANRCGNSPPNNTVFDETQTISLTYALVTDTLLNDQISDMSVTGDCNGWDPNNDPLSDPYTISFNNQVNLKYPTTPNPDFLDDRRFDRGDVLPLDWTRDNRDEIRFRLAPNLRLGETVPDFRVARYFEDTPSGDASTLALKLLDSEARPIFGQGLTPLGYTLEKFRSWYDGWCKPDDITCTTGTTGWQGVASQEDNDTSWSCRKKYVILLTDGNETCDPNANDSRRAAACIAAERLYRDDDVITFVIAFGVDENSAGNVLKCIAEKGGSTAPVYPQNQAALIDALEDIFNAIIEDARTFASAAVPAVQAEVQDKIYLTNFSPIDKSSNWFGHVDAYLKPLPLKDGKPDSEKACGSVLTSNCHLWDAGVKILDLAPQDNELSASTPNFHVGGANNQRRVFYTQEPLTDEVPLTRKLLLPASNATDKLDLRTGLGVASDTDVLNVLKATYKKKKATLNEIGKPPRNVTYVLGDIFHSNPILLSSPSRSRYFAQNLYDDRNKNCAEGDPGYRCFASKHQRRRKMLIVGSNDQQLHVFDAGIFRYNTDPERGAFDNGTGYELFSYVPRPILPNLTVLKDDDEQHWGVDGTIQIDDVFIDPVHGGTPDTTERQWRTVGVGGLREGGSGYYALDLTQPDTFDSKGVPKPDSTWIPSCWNTDGSTCGPVPFGAVLWNFTDPTNEEEDATNPGKNGPDLGQTWSTPNTGRVRVKVITGPSSPETFEDRFVAIFGGGMDPDNLNQQGNWLYMVDIETGKAIYKRVLEGSAPSDPAAVDTDQDGYLDTVYIGTTAGYLYKADLRTAATLEENADGDWKVTDSVWDPFKIFDTIQSDGRRGQIYFPPSVIFVTQLGRYALAFGTGNRYDLWAKDSTPGRFYLILDEDFAAGMTSRTEASYTDITGVDEAPEGANYLLRPPGASKPGWFMRLRSDQRMITKPFALAGITVFTAYSPRPDVVDETGGVCSRAGETRIFTLYTTTGDRIDRDAPIEGELREDFVTSPFVETSSTKNKPNEPCDPETEECDPPCDPDLEDCEKPVCEDKAAVAQRLKAEFPANCQFANFTQNIQTIEASNGLVCIAPVPVCVARKNWKEN